ncbi:TonB-dependent receptor [Spirosoma sordidisoli]|uniref:TonB-dependent receptor n=1 Tax=Spirosoma sordidisoli TaxID=2502893 RepID=A0A4V1RVE4_9BACT|nr:TonB-dependent receptor [Spirosoma sordidisoli]RYC66478.1 TonB-dependent receptor [Spirosoma sordidisoli]
MQVLLRFISLLFICLASFVGWAADNKPFGSLQGYVLDRNKQPTEGITVSLKGTVRQISTGPDGSYLFKNLSQGRYVLIVTGVGLQTQEQSAEVTSGQTTRLDITISESVQELQEVKVVASSGLREREVLPEVGQNAIYAGKKTEVVNLGALDANLITNNSRQVFSKTPGVMVWESEGSGMQVGVAVRGLSPNRSWEFNVRQNGVDISSDPFGYPEAYYNPPMQAVDRIELIRGGASLQYGPQFGGLLNYVLKKPATEKPIAVESQQSVGSYGLFSTYNSVGGTAGRWQYFGYVDYRRADGWRDNSRYNIFNGFASISYLVSNRLKIGAEVSRAYSVNQQPGGLTDAQFAQNARQSARPRNWFNVPWTVPSVTVDYALSDRTRLNLKVHGLFSERNQIGFVSAITNADVPNTSGQLANRTIDRDTYHNWGSELRLISQYNALGRQHTLSAGIKYFNGFTDRRQQGKGDIGSDFNLTLQDAAYPRALALRTTNVAAFAENLFRLSPRWSLTPGVRAEMLDNSVSGRYSFAANGTENQIDQSRSRAFALFGVGTEYKLATFATFYGNYSQAYRPVTFGDLTPAALTDFVIDPNLQDARGYTIDAGLRGNYRKFLNYDLGAYYLSYDNRIGTLTRLDAANRPYQYRTNLGRSVSKGVEAYVEIDPVVALAGRSKVGYVSLFASLGFTDARYLNLPTATVTNGKLVEGNLQDKQVENAPRFIGRFGLNYTYRTFTLTALLNRVGSAYSDANNTETPSANAQTGPIPAYQVMDLSASLRLAGRYSFKAGINNLTDERYFTRRAGGYPGPGILPADARNFYVTVGVKF